MKLTCAAQIGWSVLFWDSTSLRLHDDDSWFDAGSGLRGQVRRAEVPPVTIGPDRLIGGLPRKLEFAIDSVSNFDYYLKVKTSEFLRWLAKQGVTIEPRNGTSHHTATLGDKTTTIPVHPSKEMGTGLVNKIKKQLGLT